MSDIDLSRFIRPGNTVTWGEGTAEPLPLTRRLVRSRADLGPITVFVLATLSDTLQPEHADAFTFAGLGPAGTNRYLARAVGFETYPIHLSALPGFIADGTIAIDDAALSTESSCDDQSPMSPQQRRYLDFLVAAERYHVFGDWLVILTRAGDALVFQLAE